MDNIGEFTSKSFNVYYAFLGIKVEHLVPHVYTLNGLTESLIKRVQIITETLLLRTKLGLSAWGHAVLHATALVRIRPSALHIHYPFQLVLNHESDISHLHIFGCPIEVPIAPSQKTKIDP